MKKKDKLLIALGAIILCTVLTVVGSNIYLGNWISVGVGIISSIVLMYAMFRYIKVVNKLNKWDVCVYMHSSGQVAEASMLLKGLGEKICGPIFKYDAANKDLNYLCYSRQDGDWYLGVCLDLEQISLSQLPDIIKNSDL